MERVIDVQDKYQLLIRTVPDSEAQKLIAQCEIYVHPF